MKRNRGHLRRVAALATTVGGRDADDDKLEPKLIVISIFEARPLSDDLGNAINLEDEASNFSIKYLTSTKLMGLEAPGKNDKDLPSETMVWWKRDGCPPFEKQPIEKKLIEEGAKKCRPRWRFGNKELSQLWKWADQNPLVSRLFLLGPGAESRNAIIVLMPIVMHAPVDCMDFSTIIVLMSFLTLGFTVGKVYGSQLDKTWSDFLGSLNTELRVWCPWNFCHLI
ncbi:hypothetical protein ACH5RR_023255 [Cinchona calisaya]|uniref:Uncharacterized protein n=1 Tax=Cinchona calisaya TaxID=153742 RepID=A0ABD2ZB83_9GENT